MSQCSYTPVGEEERTNWKLDAMALLLPMDSVFLHDSMYYVCVDDFGVTCWILLELRLPVNSELDLQTLRVCNSTCCVWLLFVRHP